MASCAKLRNVRKDKNSLIPSTEMLQNTRCAGAGRAACWTPASKQSTGEWVGPELPIIKTPCLRQIPQGHCKSLALNLWELNRPSLEGTFIDWKSFYYIFLFFGVRGIRPHLVVLKAHSWLSTQESLLVGLGDQNPGCLRSRQALSLLYYNSHPLCTIRNIWRTGKSHSHGRSMWLPLGDLDSVGPCLWCPDNVRE